MTSLSGFIAPILRLTPADARERVKAARVLEDAVSVSGGTVAAVLPQTAAALAEGAISASHVHEIGRRPAEEDGEEQSRRRAFRLDEQSDGSWIPRGRHSPDSGAELNAVIDHLATPVTQKPSATDGAGAQSSDAEAHSPVDEALLGPVPDGWDPRTVAQRRHDALAELATMYLRGMIDAGSDSGVDAGADDTDTAKPSRARRAPTLILHGRAEDFDRSTGVATTAEGAQIPMWAARRLVDQATVYGVTMNSIGCVINEWRQKRLATKAQTAAVIARDRGCTIRGCQRPVRRTQIHHVVEWFDHGPSNVDNVALLCFWHHRHFAQLGYRCWMVDGVPHWTAPPYLDPSQVPRRHERFDLDVLA